MDVMYVRHQDADQSQLDEAEVMSQRVLVYKAPRRRSRVRSVMKRNPTHQFDSQFDSNRQILNM